MKDGKVVLFIPSGVYAFRQQFATAQYLASQGGFRPHFLLISETDHHLIPELSAAGISYDTLAPVQIDRQKAIAEPDDNSTNLSRGRLKGFHWWQNLLQRKRVAKRLVRPLEPICSIVSQERFHLFLPILRALRELRTPIILMPGNPCPPDGAAYLRRENHRLKAGLNDNAGATKITLSSTGNAILNRLIQRWMPSQVYESRWGRMLFYPAALILLLKLMKMLPRNPWYQGSTFADYIMISGKDEAATYDDAGIGPDKILYFGSHELDVLYQGWPCRNNLRDKFTNTYQMDPNKKIFVVSLPRLMEQNITSEEVHWQSINDILKTLSQRGCNVVVSLHPHSDPALYSWIEEKYRVNISNVPLMDTLVIADVFVASHSSTIRWAIGLGIPVINIDFWDLNYTDFMTLTGYQTVTTVPEFDDAVRRFAEDSMGGEPVGSQGQSSESRGVIVDGMAKERLLHFIESLDGASAGLTVARELSEAVR